MPQSVVRRREGACTCERRQHPVTGAGARRDAEAHRPAKVANLELAIDANEQVLGLDVAVDDVLPVQVAKRVGHLRDVLRKSQCQRAHTRQPRQRRGRTRDDRFSEKRPRR